MKFQVIYIRLKADGGKANTIFPLLVTFCKIIKTEQYV